MDFTDEQKIEQALDRIDAPRSYFENLDAPDKIAFLNALHIENVGKYVEKGLKEILENLPRVILPGETKLISEFCEEVSTILDCKSILFFRPDLKEIVEVGTIKDKDGKVSYEGFRNIRPPRFVTLLEKYICPGIIKVNVEGKKFKEKSISPSLADMMLQSRILQESLPMIQRIYTVPIPILYKGKLTFPNKGYDSRFNSWLLMDSPEITKPEMSIGEAKSIIETVFQEFCFEEPKDRDIAISALLTPFLRGLFSSPSIRTPLFVYVANRERSGKDFCAGITGIVYEGFSLEDSPISSSESNMGTTEELRKKLLSAMIQGRKRMHFANNRGHLNNATFEAVLTAQKWQDRVLGRNELMTFENEIDYSISRNIGITFTPDLANRSRFIRFFLDIEDANARVFNNPDLHNWVKNNRGIVLSALYSFVRNWIEKGQKQGSLPFTSFPEWSAICGGIMECAGYTNPCIPDRETLTLNFDNETSEIKRLFELAYEEYGERWINKSSVRSLAQRNEEHLFGYYDFDKRADQTKFALKINKFIGRIFSGIKLIVKDRAVRSARQEIMFSKISPNTPQSELESHESGNVSNVGNTPPFVTIQNTVKYTEVGLLPTLQRSPNPSQNDTILGENHD